MSHAIRSLRPSVWHDAQDACPRPDVMCVSKRNGRPCLTAIGVGSKSGSRAISELEVVSTTDTAPSKRLRTYRRWPFGESANPVGPSPTKIVAMRAPVDPIAITLLLPRPATYAVVPAAFQTTPRGSPIDCKRVMSGTLAVA